MSTKKRFSIAPDLASGLRKTIESASTNQGQLHYDMMSLDVIEPDPNNPRKLNLSREEIMHGINAQSTDYQHKHKELEDLQELSESIKRIGVRNAIEVYKDGAIYRIITGERRYWASLLAGQKSIPVRINQRMDEFNLRYTQWVENINRQDLSLWEKFNNLVLISDAYQSANKTQFSEKDLQALLGVSSIQAYRYFSLLKADDRIVELVKLSKLNNLKLVQELVTMKDKGAQSQIISWIMQSKDEVTSLSAFQMSAGKKPKHSSNGSKVTISLGKITSNDTAKQLFEIVLADQRLNKYRPTFKSIDWSSPKAITKAFKDLFKSLEKELSVEEIA